MKEIFSLDDISFAEKSQFSGKVSGAPITALEVDLQLHVDTGTSPVLALAGAHSLIDTLTIQQGSEVLVSMEGKDLAFLAQANEGYAEVLNPTTASSSNLPVKASSIIDFAALGPVGSMIDAGLGNPEVFVSGRYGAYTDACDKYSAPTDSRNGTLRMAGHSVSRVPAGGIYRPALVSHKVDLGAGPSAKRTFRFDATGEEGGVLMGFMLRAYDASKATAGLDDANADDLIRKVSMTTNARVFKGQLFTRTWGQMKRASATKFGIKRDSNGLLPQGRGFIAIEDDAAPAALRRGFAMRKGDSVELAFDTISDVEEEFGAAAGVTASSGDQVVIVPLYFTRHTSGIASTTLAGAANVAQKPKRRRRRVI